MAAMPTSPFPNLIRAADALKKPEVLPVRGAVREHSPDSAADLVGRIDEVLAVLKDRQVHAHSELSPSINAGIEARIAHLEASAVHLQRDAAQMRTDLRDIRERLFRLQDRAAHLPSRGMLALSVALIVITVIATGSFQEDVRAFAVAALG